MARGPKKKNQPAVADELDALADEIASLTPTPAPKSKRKGGRGKRAEDSIDLAVLGALVYAGCTQAEIADYFNLNPDTVRLMFQRAPIDALVMKRRAERKFSLRRRQSRLAMDGNVAMLIWLGKQELDQREPVTRHEFGEPDSFSAAEEDSLADRLDALARARRTNGHAGETLPN